MNQMRCGDYFGVLLHVHCALLVQGTIPAAKARIITDWYNGGDDGNLASRQHHALSRQEKA